MFDPHPDREFFTPLNNPDDLIAMIGKLAPMHDANAKYGFDMWNARMNDSTYHPCGCAGCIGGTARACNGGWNLEDAVMPIFGCDHRTAEKLCYPDLNGCPEGYNATPAQGIRALQILVWSGKSDWPRAMIEGAGLDPIKHREWGLGS